MDYPCIFKYDTSDDTSYWMLILALENPQKIMLTHPGVATYMHLLNRQNIGDSQSKWGYIYIYIHTVLMGSIFMLMSGQSSTFFSY